VIAHDIFQNLPIMILDEKGKEVIQSENQRRIEENDPGKGC
jgi:hypothetical protein